MSRESEGSRIVLTALAVVNVTNHVRTVADLVRFGCGLKIECRDCGSVKSLDGYQVGGMVGPGPLATVKRRLKCGRCGAKAARLTVLPPI